MNIVTIYKFSFVSRRLIIMQKCDLIQNLWRSSSLHNSKQWKMNNYIIAYIHKFIRSSLCSTNDSNNVELKDPTFCSSICTKRYYNRSYRTKPNFRMSMLMGGNILYLPFSLSFLHSPTSYVRSTIARVWSVQHIIFVALNCVIVAVRFICYAQIIWQVI